MTQPAYEDREGMCEAPGESGGQRLIAESEDWMIAKSAEYPSSGIDIRAQLTELGFQILDETHPLFFKVRPPEGWTKTTEGYWTYIRDAEGKLAFEQFYKAAVYDTRAWIKRTLAK